MINEWTVGYAVIALALLVGIYPAWRSGVRPRWLRLTLWLVLAEVAAILLWSTLGCTVLPFVGELAAPSSATEWGLCVAGSSIWASTVAVFALPFYGLVLTLYVLRWERLTVSRRGLVHRAMLLGLPPGLGLLYGYAAPFYAGVGSALLSALPMAVVGWAATTLGVLVPRLWQPQLAIGQLVRGDSA